MADDDWKKINSKTEASIALEYLQQIYNFLQKLDIKDVQKIEKTLDYIFPRNNENEGVLGYIKGNIGKKDPNIGKKDSKIEKSKQEALKIVHYCFNPKEKQPIIKISELQNFMWTKCTSVMGIMNLLSSNANESAKVKVSSIEIMILILTVFENRISPIDFDLPTLYRKLLIDSDKSGTPSVKGKVFQCLGHVASFGLNTFMKAEKTRAEFIKHYVNTVKSQVESGHNKLEVAILLGCIKGLDKYLQSFLKYEPKTSTEKQQIDDPNSEFRIELNTFFEKLELIIDPRISIQFKDEKAQNETSEDKRQEKMLKRREFQRAGLEFLANHGEFFRVQFLKKYSELYNDIIPWAKSGNLEDSRTGMNAIQRFLEVIFHSPPYQQIVTTSISSQSQNNTDNIQTAIVQVLDDKECHRSELTIGIIGVSLLSNLCTHQMIEGLFVKIIKQIESIIIELSAPIADKYSSPLALIPTYLEAVGKMLMVMDMSDENSRQLFQNRLLIVENLSVLLITSYPDLPYTSKPKAAKAFLSVVHALHNKHNRYLESFLEHVIHEACTHIIASPTQLEKEILIESIKQEQQQQKPGQNNRSSFTKINTVTSYSYFFIQLLNGPRDYYYSSSSSTTTVSDPNLIQNIYDTMIEWILKTINKLDLSLIYVDIDEDDTAENNAIDPVHNTKANTIKDFQLFYNIETLFEQLVEKTEKIQLFNSWVEVFIEKILFYIKENNLVGGFYRIMALVFEQTRKLNYFTELEEHEETFNLCCEFLEQISIQMKDFRDDLLLGVLENWLAVPDQMILKSHPCLGETLESVFRMGRNSFALAMRGIKAIERWFQIPEFPDEEMENLFNRLFPIWKSYFTTTDSTETEEKDKGKADVVSNLERKKIQAMGRETEKNPTVAKVQRKLLHLIGSYAHLIDVDVDDVQAEFSTETRFLKYGVPFKDIKPDVYLDDFLPRILDLCHDSSERQLKTLACEVFHSLVTYFIGHYSSNRNCPYDLCHRILTAVIHLGCDSDLVVRQLFNPLSIQIIRWSTLPNLEIGEMTLRDGLVQSENSSRRDFSGVCLQEYFESCLKGTSGSEQKGKQVLKYLIALSEHASSQYRHGSVLGFNSIYKNYRERRELSVQFALQLMYSFIVNLSLSHDFEENSLLIRTTKLAITRMERIILKESENLNTPMPRRKIPSNMTGSTLKHLVDWLLMKSGESWAICRKECFRLIKSFAPKLRGIGSLENYLNNLDTLKLQAIAEQSYSEEIKALEFSSDFYAFLHESNYPVELTIRRPESNFLDMLKNFLNNFDAPIETNYINLNSDTFIHYSKALKVFYNVGCLPNTILSHELSERILFLSVLVCRSLNDKTPSNIHHLVEKWKKIWTECKISSDSDLGKKLHSLFKLDLEEEYIKVNRVLWLKQVAQYGFLSEVWDEQYTCLVLNDIWEFLDRTLFEQCQTGFAEKIISNKTKNLLEALFNLALQLRERGDVIVDKVFDRTIVNQDRKTNARVFQSKGEVFQKLFLPHFPYCEKLLDFQVLINKQSIQHVGQLVQELLVEVKNKKELRKQFGKKIVQNTIKIWNHLSLNLSAPVVASLISGMASLHLQSCRESVELCNWWCGQDVMMDVNSKSLKAKSEFIHFFGLFALSENPVIVSKVISTLSTVVAEFLHPKVEWADNGNYITKISYTILTVFNEIPTNTQMMELVLKFIINVYEILSTENPCCSNTRKKFAQAMNSHNNEHRQISMANKLYELIFGQQTIDYRKNLAATKYCLLPAISSMQERAAMKFFQQHINDLVEKMQSKVATTKEQWILKIAAANLIESLILLKTSRPFFGGSDLNNAYVKGLKPPPTKEDDKQLIKDILRSAKCQNPSNTANKDIKKLIYHFNQAAYNVRIAIIKKQNYITLVKTSLDLSTDDGRWSSVIDCNISYDFPVLLEPQPLTPDNVESDTKTNPILDSLVSNSRSSRKLALAQSSLFAIDATNYDFTAALSVNDSKFHQKIFAEVDNSNSTKTSDTQVVATQSNNNVEWNRIVQHECMISVTNLIHFVAEKHPEKFGSNVVDTIKIFLLSSSGLHKNIKLFFCGAILKCKNIFKSYAADLVDPIINMILDKYFGFDLNYFMKDILIMLLEWHEISQPSPAVLKNLLNFIMPIIKPSNSRKDLARQNLRLLETIIHRWIKDSDCELPFDKIKQLLEEERPVPGLMVCKAILVGGKIPCNTQNLKELMRLIVECFPSTSKEVYILSGDVCGLILRKLKEMDFSGMRDAVEYVFKHLKTEMNKSQPLSFLLILKSIQKSFPQVINQSEYKTRVLELLHDKNLKAEALDIIPGALAWEIKNKEGESNVERKSCAESYLSDLEGRGVFRSSTNKSEQEIKALVKILEKLGDYLEEPKLLTFINQLEKVESSTDFELKSLYAETLSRIFFKFGGRRRDSILSIRILKVFSKLYSIKDSDEKLDEKLKGIVNNFWKECIQSWEHSPTLILELLEILANESNSIPITVDLITKKCAESPEYLKDIFSNPLSEDCLYEKYDLNTSYRVKSSFQPMFAESFTTLSQQVPNFPATLKSALFSQRQGTGTVGMNILKSMAAGKLRYTPTAPNQNWDDSMEIDSSFTATGASFNEADFYSDFDSESKIEEDSFDVLADLRKRFYQFPSSSSQQQQGSFYHAQREVEKQEALVRKNIENIREKQSGVKLIRSYRIGELPDIMMKHSEFLITISTLAIMDETLGRKFLVHLFTHFLNEMRDEKERFCETASTCFDSILEKYASLTDMSPQFAGLILEISTMNNMISIKSGYISNLGLNYHLEKLAIFKFESILNDSANNNSNKKVLNIKEKGAKRARVVDQETKNKEKADTLLRTAEQYRELEDFDIIRSIFHMAEKLETESSSIYKNGVLALTAENEGKYPDALELYSKLYQVEVEEMENYNKKRAIFWDTACYKCFRKLSQWDDMFDRTDQFLEGGLGTEDIDFDYVEYQRITSGVQLLVRDLTPEDQEPEIIGRVRKYLESVLGAKELELKRFVEMYPIDIAVALTVFRASESPRIFDILENFSEKSLLENFKFFDKLSRPQKKEHLLTLQRNSILLDYLDFFWCQDKHSSGEDLQTTTTQIISKWSHPGKSKFTPLINYDIIVAQKDNFITAMGTYIEDEMMDTYEENKEEFRSINYEQNMWLAELGILNGHSSITVDALKKANKIGGATENDYKLQVVSMKLKYLQTFGLEMDEVNWTSLWKKGWKNMRKYADTTTILEMKTSLLQCLSSRQLAEPLSTVEDLKQTLKISKTTTLEDYTCNEVSRLSKAISEKTGSSGELYMKMYKLLNTVGKLYTDGFSNDQNANLQKESAVCLLRGMMNGDSEAQHLFPSLFPTLEKYPEFIPTFKELVSCVPSWMFLPWLDQIVGNLNRSPYIQDALNNIIDKLLDEYPQAFQLQYTQLHSRKNFPDLFKLFADALEAVVLPSILFKKYTNHDGSLSIYPSKTNAVENCRSFAQELTEIKSNSQMYGDVHQNFAKQVLEKLIEYMESLEEKESNNEEMLDQSNDKYKTKWENFRDFVETVQGKIPECIDLKRLSPWLHNFRSSAFRDHLEVPGQYSKFEKPNTNLHPMIVSFLPTVNVISSLTKPIKLTITANTGKDVRFLVKKGDDLKQDKRIEQCFQVVNEIFKTDTFCRERRMQISTYSVIPISSDFGLIEWVDNCKSLKDLICSTPQLKKLYVNVSNQVQQKIQTAYSSKKQDTSFENPQHVFAEQASRAGAEKMFDEFKAEFPEGLLKKKIMDGCSSLEHFFVVRDKMIRSYASMCFAHWILGIGDRHLENCLVSYKTGQFLGIDFGRAFGFSIIRQGIPELVPFRLTPQIENFFSPYGSNGLFKETMIFAKRSLTKSADLMEAVIDIFVQDPSVDWLENVKITEDMPIEESKKGNWNPMEIIKMKLHSKNPIHIMDKHIQKMPSELRRIYSRVLKSGRDSSLISKTELDDEEYVDTLIEIAHDKSILVRLYEGWTSWI